ncbi:PadR family transcriptional regulator [Arthrobacter sp. HY1533]|uniref:PadR family transcriptional regulator n=1 Tax=Arthrobacter sp. HY1533 TaxID=2970919 RepID=UPI0022B9E557|nr:PadR family transcriptional regulator [Arthrobacter sp. HY1533]
MTKRSPLALTVLALLMEMPMHPYRMQQLITSRGKDRVVNVSQRASLYSTIERLTRDGLIRVAEVERDGSRPERSVYEISDAGRATARGWLTDMMSVPKHGFPEFHAALALAPVLEPGELAALLRTRRDALAAEVSGLREELEAAASFLPRVVLLDGEIVVRTREAELEFIDSVLAELASGALTWSRESLAELSKANEPHQ